MSKKSMPVQADQKKIIFLSDHIDRSHKKEAGLKAINLLLQLKNINTKDSNDHVAEIKKAVKRVIKEAAHG